MTKKRQFSLLRTEQVKLPSGRIDTFDEYGLEPDVRNTAPLTMTCDCCQQQILEAKLWHHFGYCLSFDLADLDVHCYVSKGKRIERLEVVDGWWGICNDCAVLFSLDTVDALTARVVQLQNTPKMFSLLKLWYSVLIDALVKKNATHWKSGQHLPV